MTLSDQRWIGLGLIVVSVLGAGSVVLFEAVDSWRDKLRKRMAGPECRCHACGDIYGGTE